MILWRGSLASCNYGCPYCPFAKTRDDRAALARDRVALERFCQWAEQRPYPLDILFTPWGEGLVRRYYREAMTQLSRLNHVRTVAIQTNLTCGLDWLDDADLSRLALWTTYHPGETSRARFLDRIAILERKGARYSVGMVGLKDQFAEIAAMRQALPRSAYLWVNAYKDEPDYYTAADVDFLASVDPLFELNLTDWPSRGRACGAGLASVSVNADGAARRCHFLKAEIGNIYEPDFEARLTPSPCPAAICDCHIGYSQMTDLDLRALFGQGFVERRMVDADRLAARGLIDRFA